MDKKKNYEDQIYITNTDSCEIACNLHPYANTINREEEKSIEEEKPQLISVEELTNNYRESQTISTTLTGRTFLNIDTITQQAGKYAQANGKKKKLVNRVLKAMLEEGKDTNDVTTILDIAEEVGLDKNKLAKELLPKGNSDES